MKNIFAVLAVGVVLIGATVITTKGINQVDNSGNANGWVVFEPNGEALSDTSTEELLINLRLNSELIEPGV